ncbi:MAG: hypothetical protein ABI434_18370 [Burkholderiaceae bacterium]
MNDSQSPAPAPSAAPTQQAEALRYARLLNWGTWVGIAALACSFTAYIFGLLPPHVLLDRLPGVWNQPVATYLQLTNTPTGWGWLALAQKGDFGNMIGIALLAGCSIPPLLAVIPLFFKRRDYLYSVICALIAGVLLLAASGVLTSGH